MLLNIVPCRKASQGKEYQWFMKIPEEINEVQQAVLDYEMGLANCVSLGARGILKEHIAEEIADSMTALLTLAEMYGLDMPKACEKVVKKNYERGYSRKEDVYGCDNSSDCRIVFKQEGL